MRPRPPAPDLLRSAALALVSLLPVACQVTEEGGDVRADLTEPSRRATSADGLPIAYRVDGLRLGAVGPRVPELVLVHGLGGDRALWTQAVADLAGEAHLVSLDLGGHGASGTWRTEWTLEALAEDVVAVVQAEDLARPVLVGHGVGARACLLAAARLAQRDVRVIVVEDLHDVEHGIDPGTLERLELQLTGDYESAVAALVEVMLGPQVTRDLRDTVVAHVVALPEEIGRPLLFEYLEADEGAALAACPAPVALIEGRWTPTNLPALRRVRPDAPVRFVDGAQRFPMLERPAAFTRALREVLAEWGL